MRRIVIFLWVISLLSALYTFSSRAQDLTDYDHPLFSGPVHDIPYSLFDQEHLRLALHFDVDEARVFGDASLRIRPIEDSLGVLILSGIGLDIDSVWVGDTDSTMHWTENWTVGTDSIVIGLDSLAYAHPDSLIRRNQSFNVRVMYSARPKKGLYFLKPDDLYDYPQIWTQGNPEDHRHWLPIHDYPDDRLSIETLVTVDEPLRVLANGTLLNEVAHEDDRITYHYLQRQPIASFLIAFVVGDFEVVPERLTLANGRHVALDYWVEPAQTGLVPHTFGRTADMMRFFSERLSYPYSDDRYAQVILRNNHDDEMDHSGITMLSNTILVDEHGVSDYDPTDLIARRLAYHWFGNVISSDYWTDNWLSEGFASYLSALYFEETRGDDGYGLYMQDLAARYVEESKRYRRPVVWDQWEEPGQMFDAHSREKGAWILHVLRRKMGDDRFWRVLEIYIKRHAFEPIQTPAFRETLEAVTNEDYVDFFDQWVYSAGHPVLETSYSYQPAEESITIQIGQMQSGYLVPDVFDITLDVEVYTLAGPASFNVRLNQREQTFTLPLDMPPRFVIIDPNQNVLMENRLEQQATAWVAQLRYSDSVVNRIKAAQSIKDYSGEVDILIGLRSAFNMEASEDVRKEIIETISTLPPTISTQRLLFEAYNDVSTAVRETVIRALAGFYDNPEVSTFIVRAAERDESSLVQAAAVLTLARLGVLSAANIARSALITPSYRDVIRQAGLKALSLLDIPEREQIAVGIEYSSRDYSPEVRSVAIRFLAPLAASNSRIRNRLISYLEEQDDNVRKAAIRALSESTNRTVRQALLRCQEQELRPHLYQLLQDILSTFQDE